MVNEGLVQDQECCLTPKVVPWLLYQVVTNQLVAARDAKIGARKVEARTERTIPDKTALMVPKVERET